MGDRYTGVLYALYFVEMFNISLKLKERRKGGRGEKGVGEKRRSCPSVPSKSCPDPHIGRDGVCFLLIQSNEVPEKTGGTSREQPPAAKPLRDLGDTRPGTMGSGT